MVEEVGSPIKEYISSTLKQIKDSLPEDARADGIVNIEISTITQKNKEGGVDIKVVNFGADVSQQQIHKITIPIRILTETGKMIEEANKAEAEAKKAVAEKMKQEISG